MQDEVWESWHKKIEDTPKKYYVLGANKEGNLVGEIKQHVNYPAAQAAGLLPPDAAFYWGTFACVYAGPWAVYLRLKTKNGIRVLLFARKITLIRAGGSW